MFESTVKWKVLLSRIFAASIFWATSAFTQKYYDCFSSADVFWGSLASYNSALEVYQWKCFLLRLFMLRNGAWLNQAEMAIMCMNFSPRSLCAAASLRLWAASAQQPLGCKRLHRTWRVLFPFWWENRCKRWNQNLPIRRWLAIIAYVNSSIAIQW